MTDPTDDARADRRAELIAAALASDLSPAEAVELDALRASDPSVDAEIAALSGVVAGVGAVGLWSDVVADDALRRRVESAVADDGRAEEAPVTSGGGVASDGHASDGHAPVVPLRPPRRSSSPRRAALVVLGAAACVAVGVGGGVLATTPRDAHVAGPPGTLGAVEEVAFAGEPSGVAVDGDLVAHTWGTETVLTVDGLPVGDAFSVVVVDDEGVEHESGTFLGTDVTIDCRMNAAVLREHVAAVEIRGADGAEIATATVPAVPA